MDKARSGERGNNSPLGVPDEVLRVVKIKGVIDTTDLQTRTVTVKPNKKEDPALELGFPQPAGREQIKAGKKAEKVLGKKNLTLEELKPGWDVTLEYYPVLGQILSLTIEELPS